MTFFTSRSITHRTYHTARPISRSRMRQVWPLFVFTTLTASRQVQAQETNLQSVVRRFNADVQTLNRLRAAVRRQHRLAGLTWTHARRRARWMGAVPEFRFRYSKGVDDGQRSSLSIEEANFSNDIDSTASQGSDQRFIGELRWQPALLIFHPTEIRSMHRQQALESSQLEIRLRIGRVFMARRAAIIRWASSDSAIKKAHYWTEVLERDAELDELTGGLFSRLIRRKQN